MAERSGRGSRRRKRKQRGSRAAEGPPPSSAVGRGYAKAEERNRAVRETLDPLEAGERPLVVAIGAVFAAIVALIFWVSFGISVLTDTTVNGTRPSPLPLVSFAVIMTVMAAGMWRARYWAVLGFQMLLVLFLLAAVAGVVNAGTWLQLVGTALLIAVCGALFFFMVKAMARIQMPERPGQN